MKTFDVNNIQIEIQSPGMTVDAALENTLISHIEKLGKIFPRINKCELILRVEKDSTRKICFAEANLFLPSHVLFARSREVDFETATQKLFHELHEQLVKVKEKFEKKKIVTEEEIEKTAREEEKEDF